MHSVTALVQSRNSRVIASAFKNYILDQKEIRTPVKTMSGATFCHIMEGELFVVAIARHNVNAALVFELLHKIVETFKSYFQTVDEESIRKNFVLIYELLDEIVDFGHPQLSSSVCDISRRTQSPTHLFSDGCMHTFWGDNRRFFNRSSHRARRGTTSARTFAFTSSFFSP